MLTTLDINRLVPKRPATTEPSQETVVTASDIATLLADHPGLLPNIPAEPPCHPSPEKENEISLPKHEILLQIVDIPYFARKQCGFICDPHQAGLLYRATKRTILNCSRQVGKSTIAALKAVHAAYHRPGITILITSPTKQQSRELTRKIRTFAYLSGSSLRGSRDTVEFKNGARVLAIAADEDTVRGFSAVALLIIDEAARVSDEVYFALLPTLAVSGGSVWLLSTPKNKRGFFYSEWTNNDKDRWAQLRIKAEDCPRINPDFLQKQRRRLGERRFMQDYQCHFLDSSQGVFDPESIRRAFTDTIKPLDF
jgi:hypothetical protein